MFHKLFTFPIKSVIKITEKIHEEAENELYNLQRIQEKIMQLHLMFEEKEIDEETYISTEKELLTRYKIAREREKEKNNFE